MVGTVVSTSADSLISNDDDEIKKNMIMAQNGINRTTATIDSSKPIVAS
jgi:hypothetical protein